MNDSATLIGDDLRVEGLLEGEGDLVVAGHVQGVVRITGTLTVTRSGVVLADVNAHGVQLDGSLEGDVRVASSVRIGPHGRLHGAVRGRLEVAEGGIHRGALKTPRPSSRTDYAARLPRDRDTVPSAESAPSSSPGAKKGSFAPTTLTSGEHPVLDLYGEPALSRRDEPRRGPPDFAITTGEPAAVDSGDHPPISGGPMPPPAWMLEGSELDEIETAPGLPSAPAPDGPLRLVAGDLVAESEEPPAREVSSPSLAAIRLPADAPGLLIPDDGPPVRVNAITSPGADPSDLPRGRTELFIPNPPARRTTAPGVAPFREGFHETTSKIAALTDEELAAMQDEDDAR